MAQISRWVWSNCATLVVGCTLYSNYERTTVYASKQITISIGGIKKVYSTMSSGVIVSISTCSWTSQAQYNSYAPLYTGTRNNCGTGGSGSTINVNDGGAYSFAGTTSPIISYVSQGDADSQAQTASQNSFNAGIQNYINSNASCTYTYNNGSASYPATNYTRNNCPANCEGGTVTYGQVNKSGYGATVSSPSTYQDAIDLANSYAYSAARTESQVLGQNYANANGSCCCWNAVSEADKCDGCNYRGNMERNDCSGSIRNTTPTAYNYCGCNQNCAGTYYTDYYCNNRDKVYVQKYNCNGSATGATNRVNCGCDAGYQELSPTGYDTCVGCTTFTVYYDGNRCSGTGLKYIVNGSSVGTTEPSRGGCNTTPNYNLDRGVICYGGTNYQVYQNTNGCNGGVDQFQYRNGGGGVEFTSNDFGSDPCTFYAYKSGSFTRNNCGSGYNGGTVTYSHTYSYTGILNQSGADATANSNFPTDGQNYANSAGSCTAIQICKVYDIIAYDYGYYVDGYYTYCNGGTGYFSFYANSSGSIGQTPCVNASSVYITNYGNGAAVQESYSC
jgi:Family of unknown function (DUF5977)